MNVVSVEHRKVLRSAYNLTVRDTHTFYVVAGNVPLLVHNGKSKPPPMPKIVEDAAKKLVAGQLRPRPSSEWDGIDRFEGRDLNPAGQKFWQDTRTLDEDKRALISQDQWVETIIYDFPEGGNDYRLAVWKKQGEPVKYAWFPPKNDKNSGHNYGQLIPLWGPAGSDF